MTDAEHSNVVNSLVERIRALIPDHPEVLAMQDVGGLTRLPGFKYDDLDPTLFQVSWALSSAQALGAAPPTTAVPKP